jgi:hypothetical protein
MISVVGLLNEVCYRIPTDSQVFSLSAKKTRVNAVATSGGSLPIFTIHVDPRLSENLNRVLVGYVYSIQGIYQRINSARYRGSFSGFSRHASLQKFAHML